VAAPAGIATDDADPLGVGAGDGVGDGAEGDDEELLPQAIADIKSPETMARRNENM